MQTFAPSKSLARKVAIRQGRRGVAARAADVAKIEKTSVPLELEEGDMPMNTFTPKKSFTAKVKSVERIVGPKVSLALLFSCPLFSESFSFYST